MKELLLDKHISSLILVPPARDCEAFGYLPLDELGDHAKQPPESAKRYIYLVWDVSEPRKRRIYLAYW